MSFLACHSVPGPRLGPIDTCRDRDSHKEMTAPQLRHLPMHPSHCSEIMRATHRRSSILRICGRHLIDEATTQRRLSRPLPLRRAAHRAAAQPGPYMTVVCTVVR